MSEKLLTEAELSCLEHGGNAIMIDADGYASAIDRLITDHRLLAVMSDRLAEALRAQLEWKHGDGTCSVCEANRAVLAEYDRAKGEAMSDRYDVVAVNIDTSAVRLLATDKDRSSAEAIVNRAVMRRGVDEEFFAAVERQLYRDGDKWR